MKPGELYSWMLHLQGPQLVTEKSKLNVNTINIIIRFWKPKKNLLQFCKFNKEWRPVQLGGILSLLPCFCFICTYQLNTINAFLHFECIKKTMKLPSENIKDISFYANWEIWWLSVTLFPEVVCVCMGVFLLRFSTFRYPEMSNSFILISVPLKALVTCIFVHAFGLAVVNSLFSHSDFFQISMKIIAEW